MDQTHSCIECDTVWPIFLYTFVIFIFNSLFLFYFVRFFYLTLFSQFFLYLLPFFIFGLVANMSLVLL